MFIRPCKFPSKKLCVLLTLIIRFLRRLIWFFSTCYPPHFRGRVTIRKNWRGISRPNITTCQIIWLTSLKTSLDKHCNFSYCKIERGRIEIVRGRYIRPKLDDRINKNRMNKLIKFGLLVFYLFGCLVINLVIWFSIYSVLLIRYNGPAWIVICTAK